MNPQTAPSHPAACPTSSLLVISEDAENDISDAHLALEALAWMLESAASANIKLKNAGQNLQTIDLMPDSFAALLRVVGDKIKPHTNLPSLASVEQAKAKTGSAA